MHHHDPATARQPAVAVVVAVDGGVELVVAAQRLQQQVPVGHLEHLQRAHRELCSARRGLEGSRVPRRVRQHEAARSPHLLVVRVAARHDVADVPADDGVVLGHGVPVDPRPLRQRAQGGLGEAADDPRPRSAGAGSPARCGPPRGAPLDIESSTVTPCHPAGSRPARCGRGRAGSARSRPGSTCVRLSLVETCTVRSSERIASGVTSVSGVAATKLPPSAEEHLEPPVRQRPDGVDGVVAALAAAGRSRTPGAARRRSAAGSFSQMPIVRSPCTLEWPRTGHSPAPGLPMLPCSERDVDDLLDRRDRVAVLGDAHRPADDRPPRGGEHRPPRARSAARVQPGRAQRRRPSRGRAMWSRQVSKPVVWRSMKSRSTCAARSHEQRRRSPGTARGRR